MGATNTEKKKLPVYKRAGFGTIIVFVLLVIVFSLISDAFLTLNNIMTILQQNSALIIMSMGMTMVIITGGIDLSVGGNMALCSICATMLIRAYDLPIIVGVLICLAVGSLVGLCNGICVTTLGIPPLLATIGMDSVTRGLAYIICDGATINKLPDSFKVLGRGYLFGVLPIAALIAAVVVIIYVLLQNHTAFAVRNYAIGGNEKAAFLSGVKTRQHLRCVYVLMGFTCGMAAYINASRLGVGLASVGSDMSFDAVTASVLGGTSIAGGSGKVQRAVLGALIIGVIFNGLTILNVQSFEQQVAKGLILILSIGVDTVRHRKAE